MAVPKPPKNKSRAKARLLAAKAHERVAFARNDFQHKLSKQLIDENQAVIVETLSEKYAQESLPCSTGREQSPWRCSLHRTLTNASF